MAAVHALIEGNLLAAWIVLVLAFVVLAKSADLFVRNAVTLAEVLKVPKLVIGIVLVSLATTAPELTVSLMAALQGQPEIAIGNAIGSVICDDGLALPLCALFSATAIPVIPRVLRTSGLFLLFIEGLVFVFVLMDRTLSRGEGVILVALFVGYMAHLFRQHRRGLFAGDVDVHEVGSERESSTLRLCVLFAVGLVGIVLASEFIITSATTIATSFQVPKAVIALTIVAFGTSIPEVATCVVAARRGEGSLAVGNILGADIMNICWVAGASAIANDLTLGSKEIYFMFPWMFIIVGTMLLLLRIGYNLNKKKALVIFALYLAYLASSVLIFPPQT
jgi:cation:H+ antiporter